MASEFVLKRRVQFNETDMAGIVHFANFFRYMEEAEAAFWRSIDLSLRGAGGGKDFGWPRVRATCDYLAPVRFEDCLEIHLFVKEVRRRSIEFAFRIWRCSVSSGEREAETARGGVIVVCTRMANGERPFESIEIPSFVREKMEPAPPAAYEG